MSKVVKSAGTAAGVGIIGVWGANAFIRRRRTRDQVVIAVVILAIIAAVAVYQAK